MGKKRRNMRPGYEPVERVELDESHPKRKIVWLVISMLAALGVLAWAVSSLLITSAGWRTVETDAQAQMNAASEFVLTYDIGRSGAAPQAEYREVSSLYTRAAEKAWQLFGAAEYAAGVHNIRYINNHPNEDVTVEPALYKALETVTGNGARYLYLGPVYDDLDSLFASTTAEEAYAFDPVVNPDEAAYFAAVAAFAADPGAIDLVLTGGDSIRLNVSDAYLAFAGEYGLTRWIDFGWMKNAFIADLLADALTGAGHTAFTLTSYDGFSRTPDAGSTSYSAAFVAEDGNGTALTFTGPRSSVSLRSFRVDSAHEKSWYVAADRTVRSAHIDPADGAEKAAFPALTLYSADASCAELLMQALPVFIADSADTARLEDLAGGGVYAVWSEGGIVKTTDPVLTVK